MKFHLALAVENLDATVADYTRRLGQPPDVVIPNAYALWRVGPLNLSARVCDAPAGTLRHIGFEDPAATAFTSSVDCNGVMWENFAYEHQVEEILEAWPDCGYGDKKDA